MTVLEACKELRIWNVVRGYAEVWLGAKNPDDSKVKILAKNQFKKLARQYHPDMPTGDNDKYLKISEALKIIENAKLSEILCALDHDEASKIKYYNSGDPECKQCSKWNSMFNNCVFSSCNGFDLNEISKVETKNCQQPLTEGRL